MKWFKNLKIANKLILAFLILAIAAGGIGYTGIHNVLTANAQSESLFKNYGNSQGDLGYVFGEFNKQMSMCRDALIEKAKMRTQHYIEAISASDAILNAHLAAYEQTRQIDEEKTAYADLKQKLDAFVQVRDSYLQLCLEEKYMKAFELLRSDEATKAIDEASAAIESAVASNVSQILQLRLFQP